MNEMWTRKKNIILIHISHCIPYTCTNACQFICRLYFSQKKTHFSSLASTAVHLTMSAMTVTLKCTHFTHRLVFHLLTQIHQAVLFPNFSEINQHKIQQHA